MVNTEHIRFNAEDRSYHALLKKEIHNLAAANGFSTSKLGEIDIVVAEIASNLIKHAGGGQILVGIFQEDNNTAIELISIDNGPGISDPIKMMQDGMSTANTLGHGLGAIKRLSDTFEIYSLKDWGTVLLSRIYKNELPHHKKKRPVEVRSLILPKPGEKVSGDGAYYDINENRLKVFLGDGLGHGTEAHLAVHKAMEALGVCADETPVGILRYLHGEVKKTRGLVCTVAIYDFNEKLWRLCGVGNIATRFVSVNTKNSMSYNGVIGMNIPNTLNSQEIAHERGQTLIMCSDGLKSRWELQKYVGIFRYDLSVLAAVMYKDFARGTDDMSVLAVRINATV